MSDTSGARLFAELAQQSAGGSLSAEQLACLQSAYAELDSETLQAFLGGALNPTAVDPDVVESFEQLFADCGIGE